MKFFKSVAKEKSDAFKAIYDNLYNYVAVIVMSITHDKAAFYDLTHDVFVKYIESFDVFPSVDESKAWLGIVARNVAINWNNKKNNRNELDTDDECINSKSDSFACVEDIVVDKESIQYIYDRIYTLDKKYSDILMLNLKYEYQPQQIASLLGLNVKTVYTRLDRGKKLLRSILSERGVRND